MGVLNVVSITDIKEYNSLKQKLDSKKNIIQFLPQQLKVLSKEKNFFYKGKKLKSAYIIDILHNLILKYYFRGENKFYLSSLILKDKYGYLYNYYIDYLLDNEMIVLLSKHKKGRNSRIYSIKESLLNSKISRYNNCDKILLKKYKKKFLQIEENKIENSLIDNDIKKKLINDLFYVEILSDKSIFYLNDIKEDDFSIYNRNKYSIECINDKHIFYHFDNYGRMHTNFTILKSFIRKNCLLIDGEETYEIDIKNSQPLFLTKLIQDTNTKWVLPDEFELFKKLTISGKYYQYIMNNLGIKDKNIVKELTYKVLFGQNRTNSKADKMFSKLFPTIHNFIKLYKKENGDYKVLAYELQKAESNLIFNKIIRQIMNLYPDIKIITVHDSIIVPKSRKDEVKKIFNFKLYEEFGII